MTITCQSCQRQRKHLARGYCRSCYYRHWLERQPIEPCRRCQRDRHIYAKGYCLSCHAHRGEGHALMNRRTQVACDVCRQVKLCCSYHGRGRYCERCYHYKRRYPTLPYNHWRIRYFQHDRAKAWAQGISEEQRQALPSRLQELIRLQATGLNLTQIGARFGVSREYVRQLRVKAQQFTA